MRCSWTGSREASGGPGGTPPSEFGLAADLATSQGTVRKALDEMAAENLVVIDGRPAEWRRSWCRTDDVHYLSELR